MPRRSFSVLSSTRPTFRYVFWGRGEGELKPQTPRDLARAPYHRRVQKGGFTEEESLVVLEELETAGCDFVEISGGTYG